MSQEGGLQRVWGRGEARGALDAMNTGTRVGGKRTPGGPGEINRADDGNLSYEAAVGLL
jgi:hypothetical protein